MSDDGYRYEPPALRGPRWWYWRRASLTLPRPGGVAPYFGGDEWDRHTLAVPIPLAGTFIIALRSCRGKGRCAGRNDPKHADYMPPCGYADCDRFATVGRCGVYRCYWHLDQHGDPMMEAA